MIGGVGGGADAVVALRVMTRARGGRLRESLLGNDHIGGLMEKGGGGEERETERQRVC
jgi:hypothetical protein